MKMQIRKKDKRLLFELSSDPNASIAQLAERSQLSRDQVAYRLERYESEKLVVRYFPLISLARLGISHYLFRLKLRSANAARIEEFVRYLVAQPSITWVARMQGEYDIGISLRCRGGEEVTEIVDQLLESHNSLILERSFAIYTRVGYFGRDYLIDRKSRKYVPPKKLPSKYSPLDRTNLKILQILSKNNRTRPSEIAEELVSSKTVGSITREAVAYRINKLESDGWITGAFLVLNPAAGLGLYYKVEITLEHVSTSELERLSMFCRTHPHVVLFFRLIGQWDFEIDLEVASHEQAREFVMELTEHTPNTVRDYSVLLMTSLDKWDISASFNAQNEED